MRHAVMQWSTAFILTVGMASGVWAQEAQKTLPTLLIKGEVVSVDTSDAQAALLKVKDRYGFETPIYLSNETTITQGDQALAAANLSAGTAITVEYNFDINTAKRHAVSVAVSAPAATAAAEPAVTPAVPATPAPEAVPVATPSPTESAPAQPAEATSEQPAAPSTTP